jgi:hypothetical protein
MATGVNVIKQFSFSLTNTPNELDVCRWKVILAYSTRLEHMKGALI